MIEPYHIFSKEERIVKGNKKLLNMISTKVRIRNDFISGALTKYNYVNSHSL